MGLFEKLPEESIEQIVAGIGLGDLLSLRITCRSLYTKTYDAFGRAFFTIVRTDFQAKSLRRLQRIAEKFVRAGVPRHERRQERLSALSCAGRRTLMAA
jgi:hypothetical protein